MYIITSRANDQKIKIFALQVFDSPPISGPEKSRPANSAPDGGNISNDEDRVSTLRAEPNELLIMTSFPIHAAVNRVCAAGN